MLSVSTAIVLLQKTSLTTRMVKIISRIHPGAWIQFINGLPINITAGQVIDQLKIFETPLFLQYARPSFPAAHVDHIIKTRVISRLLKTKQVTTQELLLCQHTLDNFTSDQLTSFILHDLSVYVSPVINVKVDVLQHVRPRIIKLAQTNPRVQKALSHWNMFDTLSLGLEMKQLQII